MSAARKRPRGREPTAGGHIKPRKVRAYGHIFDSDTEFKRFAALRLRTMTSDPALKIWDLEAHPKFAIVINNRKIGRGYMKLDNGYKCWRDGAVRQVYEQVKGDWDDPCQHWKNQVCMALHNITIIEVRL